MPFPCSWEMEEPSFLAAMRFRNQPADENMRGFKEAKITVFIIKNNNKKKNSGKKRQRIDAKKPAARSIRTLITVNRHGKIKTSPPQKLHLGLLLYHICR